MTRRVRRAEKPRYARLSCAAVLLVATWLGTATPASAGPAYLVKDVNTEPDPRTHSQPREWAVIGDVTYFAANDGIHGMELWRTDGTTAGTWMVKDILPGEFGSGPSNLGAVNGVLYFFAHQEEQGGRLWQSDGSEAGTKVITSFFIEGSGFMSYRGAVYFCGYDDIQGGGLWRTDGTSAGTVLVAHICPPSVTVVADILYFLRDDGEHGYELWRSDGTAAGTTLVRDIDPGVASGIPYGATLQVAGGLLLFPAHDSEHGTELWRSDGTADGTYLLVDTVPGDFPGLITNTSGFTRIPMATTPDGVYFFVLVPATPPFFELWHTDGTANGTRPIAPSPGMPFGTPSLLGDSVIFFYGSSFFSDSSGIFKANRSGVELLGAGSFPHGAGSPIAGPLVSADQVFFLLDEQDGCTLWRTDGTAAGTLPVKKIGTVFCGFYDLGDWLWIAPTPSGVAFAARDSERGIELFHSNGTSEGTALLADINDKRLNTDHAGPHPSAVLNDRVLLFTATERDYVASGRTTGLWRTDGTGEGTQKVADVHVSASVGLGDRMVFAGFASSGPPKLWVSDGSATGTVPVHSVDPSSSYLVASQPGTEGAVAFFVGTDQNARGLWRTNGTMLGTEELQRFDFRDTIRGFSPSKDRLFYGLNDRELWQSDGTPGGTNRVRRFADGELGQFFPDGEGGLCFTVTDSTGRIALWRSDGTAQGTARLTGYRLAGVGSHFAFLDDLLLFVASDGISGFELWRSDFTEEGTWLLRDINPGPISSWPELSDLMERGFDTAGAQLLFSATDDVHGIALWRSDGTVTGTTLVRDIDRRTYERLAQTQYYGLTEVGERVIFAPYAASIGREPWISDGTPQGTYAIDDLAPGLSSSFPYADLYISPGSFFTATAEHVFFAADDKRHGYELWAIRRADLGAPRPCVGDCNGDGRAVINEVISAVNIALGVLPLEQCLAVDGDGDRTVVIAELVRAVGNALAGC